MTDHLDPDIPRHGIAEWKQALKDAAPYASYSIAYVNGLLADHARLTDQLAAERDNADREIARLTAENDLLRRRVEIQTEVGIGQEKYADRLTAENDRLRNDVAVLADRLIPGGPR